MQLTSPEPCSPQKPEEAGRTLARSLRRSQPCPQPGSGPASLTLGQGFQNGVQL